MILIPPHRTLFKELLKHACDQNLHKGRALHAHLIKTSSFPSNIFLSNAILNLYAKSALFSDSERAFSQIQRKDIVSWNTLINAYSQQNGSEFSLRVVELFKRMRAENVVPDARTLAGVCAAVADLGCAWVGKQAHSVAVKVEDDGGLFIGSALVNVYCKSGLIGDARKMFDEMSERNSVTWATMVSGYALNGMGEEAVGVFKMGMEGGFERGNPFVLTSVLSGLIAPEFSGIGKQIHGLGIKDGSISAVEVRNALVIMYARCGSLDDAVHTFEMSKDKNAITWSAMICGLAQSGDSRRALGMFSKMHYSGVIPSEYTFVGVINACSDIGATEEGKQAHGYSVKMGYQKQIYIMTALVDMYAKCSSLDDARKGFEHLQEPDIVLWTSMIGGYVQNGDNEGALSLYGRMEAKGIPPNELTMASILKACSKLAALEQGKQIHAHTVKYGFSLQAPIGSALSTMYAKCGCMEEGKRVFQRMPVRDLVSWNAMISGLAQNGCHEDALSLFDEMLLEGVKPDDVTFVNILSACSHMGLVGRGWSYFKMMLGEFGIDPGLEHHACMVDIYSRAGRLNEAKEFIESANIEHGMCLWRVLLSASVNFGHYELGAYAGEKLMKLGSQESSAYVLLSKIYVALGKLDDAERVMRLMKLRGVEKERGCSWVELKNHVHVFVVGDQMHPQIEDICSSLRFLTKQMMDEVDPSADDSFLFSQI